MVYIIVLSKYKNCCHHYSNTSCSFSLQNPETENVCVSAQPSLSSLSAVDGHIYSKLPAALHLTLTDTVPAHTHSQPEASSALHLTALTLKQYSLLLIQPSPIMRTFI